MSRQTLNICAEKPTSQGWKDHTTLAVTMTDPNLLEQPSMDLTWSHLAGSVKLLLNFSFYYFAVRNRVQPKAAPAWV